MPKDFERMEAVSAAFEVQSILKGRADRDPFADRRDLTRSFQSFWARRIGRLKFGAAWEGLETGWAGALPCSVKASKTPRELWDAETIALNDAVPVRVLFDAFWKASTDEEMLEVIDAYEVGVLTRDEKAALGDARLSTDMPVGWVFGDDPRARWSAVGIEMVAS